MAAPTINVCPVESRPFLATFSNGELVTEAAGGLKTACFDYSGTEHKHKGKYTLVCEGDSVQYVGRSTGPQNGMDICQARYMLAAHNRRTGKVQLYNSDRVRLHPYFPDRLKQDTHDETDLTFAEKNDELTSAFGGVKKRRAMESRIKNAIKGESLEVAMSSVVEDVLARPDAAEIIAKPAVPTTSEDMIPPYDSTATEPAGVYDLYTIIDNDIMSAMATPAALFADASREQLKEWDQGQKYGSYIMGHLAMLPVDQAARLRRCSILFYIHYMSLLFCMKHTDIRKSTLPFPEGIPTVVSRNLAAMFTMEAIQPGKKFPSRCMPVRMKDKLLAYICVLCLILDEYSVDYNKLMVDLKLSLKRITMAFRSLGCYTKEDKISSGGGTYTSYNTATLKIPLVFPELTVKNKNKTRR